jgi:thioredoxin reductase (NADPH)
MEKVVIIGSGPAGWTAALYTARAQLAPLVLTGQQPGGLLTTTSIVENFPGFPEGVDGYELMTRMQKQAERFGARVKFGTLESIEKVPQRVSRMRSLLSSKRVSAFRSEQPSFELKRPFELVVDGEIIQTQTIIIATGASHKHLGVPGESLLENKGVTYCATCDGALPFFRNQPLVVVGGGDSACEEAMYLTRFGSIVYLVHRRDSLRASKIMAERTLANPKIKPIWDSAVTEILDVKQDKVTGVKLKNLKTDKDSILDCAGVFIAIGHTPNTRIFDGQIKKDTNGFIKSKLGTTMTHERGVFVAGDCADHVYRQAVTAAGAGCAAAIDAERFLAAENA